MKSNNVTCNYFVLTHDMQSLDVKCMLSITDTESKTISQNSIQIFSWFEALVLVTRPNELTYNVQYINKHKW